DPFTLRLERSAQVEIFVNGSLIHKGYHSAGELNLRNYPLITGKNLVSVVITDDRGRVERVQYDRFYHAELLVQGLTEYSFNVFNDSSENDSGELEYERETRGSAFFRYGLFRNLTTGVNYQSL